MSKNKKSSFTLIELLVVIAIIGLLSTVVLVSLSGVRARARDTRRKADMRTIQTALEEYYNDNNAYPSTGMGYWGVCVYGGSKTTTGANAYIPGLTPNYINTLPVDPLGILTEWSGYLYVSDGNNYKLTCHSTGPESYPSAGDLLYDPVRPTWAWKLCSGEPACSTW